MRYSRWFGDRDLKSLIPKYIERGWEMGSSVATSEILQEILAGDNDE